MCFPQSKRFIYTYCFDLFRYSLPLLFENGTLPSSPSIILGTMSFWDGIRLNLISATLRSRARIRPRSCTQARSRAWEQICWESERTFFSTPLRPSAGNVIRSPSQNNAPSFDSVPFLQRQPFNIHERLELPWIVSLRQNWNKIRQIQVRSSLSV